MKRSKHIFVGVAFCFMFAIPVLGKKFNINFRPLTEQDREWAINIGVQRYMNIYQDKMYFINARNSSSLESRYQLLAPDQFTEKKRALIAESHYIVDQFLQNEDDFRAIVLLCGKKPIGGLFYRLFEDGVLVIDEALFDGPISEDVKKYVLTDYLRLLEPAFSIHKFFVRSVNKEELSYFSRLGFEPQEPEVARRYNYDPVLYLSLSKTYANSK